MAYIGKSPSVGVRDRFYYTAAGSETSISGADDNNRVLSFTDGKYVDVMLNGITLVADVDYNTTTANTISGLDALTANDVIEVTVYDVFSIADTVSAARGGTFNGPVTVEGTVEATSLVGDGSGITNVVRNIDSLGDVDTTGLSDGNVLKWNDSDEQFEPGSADLADDTSPQLGGDLDGNGYTINLGSNTTAITIPTGTTAQRPGSPVVGMVRMNTTTGSMEFHDGTGWIATNLVPSINSITGTIYVGIETTLDINITNASDTVDVRYLEGGILLATDRGVSVTAGVATSTVPAAVYGQSNGDTITIQIVNEDGTPSSNSVNKTVQGVPTGGTITTAAGYRIHTFTSSGTFTVPSGFSSSAEYLVVAGGGSGGNNKQGTFENGGGGGAGGMLTGSTTITAQSYGVTVGAGGAIPGGNGQTRGNNSSALGVTCIGGGGGSTRDSQANINGGSGGGAVNYNPNTVNGIGTAGQGNNGGVAGIRDDVNGGSAGGGGKGAPGGNTSGGTVGANGGVGQISNITGSSVYYAGGGAGGGGTGGTGGLGGGGNAGSSSSPNGSNGQANTGGGGGGNFAEVGNAGNGGSGIVVIRYPFTI